MKTNYYVCFLLMVVSDMVLAWSPSQASARNISLEYNLFQPFGTTEIDVNVDDDGYIKLLSISTNGRVIIIPPSDLEPFRHPSLTGIEIMHYGEKDEASGFGGTFSLCIPYGRIERIENETFWQRPLLAVYVTPYEARIRDIPLPKGNTRFGEVNGCHMSAKKVYGY